MTESSLSIYKEEPWNSPSAMAITPPEPPKPTKDVPDGSDELHNVLCEMYAEMEIERRMAQVHSPVSHDQENVKDDCVPEIRLETFTEPKKPQGSKSCSKIATRKRYDTRLSSNSYALLSNVSKPVLKPISKWKYKQNGTSFVYGPNRASNQHGETKVVFSTKTKPGC